MAEYKPLSKLTAEQALASRPHENVWLSASAGTGKTQVLSARVLRLLLDGAKPESILCLTFTKAGAAEMAERVYGRLAAWVRASEKHIRADLFNLGEKTDVDHIERARTLFARVLDARGGGLRIQTIHSFCQILLSGFPAEAGLPPGFRPMEERETAQLAQQVLADLVSDAVAQGEHGFLSRLKALVLLRGEEGSRSYLMACARKHRDLETLGSGVEAKVRTALGLPLEDVGPFIEAKCGNGGFDEAELKQIAQANAIWKTSTGLKRADIVAKWLQLAVVDRASALDDLVLVWTKADGERRVIEKNLLLADPYYAELCDHAFQHFNGLIELKKLDSLATQISGALLVGQRYATAYAEAKRKTGGVDFDDLIHITAALLNKPSMGDWIRYKLDQSTDHILVDEAQDTNDAQWNIIKALAGEFYSGEGAKAGQRRTIFTVGDTKQAIFGFQGTDPRAMATARAWFDQQAQGVGRALRNLNMLQSYRSSPPVLALVDAVINDVGAENMGLEAREMPHEAALGSAGHVMMFPPVEHGDDADEDSEEGWVQPSNRILARQIAERVAGWLKAGLWIEDRNPEAKYPTRRLEAKDVMILLRSRGELAPLLVARLHEAGVPVAGIDRLRLNTPLVVRDVMAAIRFVLQPLDDLNLACLLVSPLIGWTQEALQDVAIARGKSALWPHLRAALQVEALTPLHALLNMGDRLTPSRFMEALLSGPLRGRAKLLERFGREARDPLDELMNAALAFERAEVSSLQGFLNWFERGDIDIKRDAEADANAVRVLTVHGAKGLQAPLVILADATSNPDGRVDRLLDWPIDALTLPIPRPPKHERMGGIADAADVAKSRDMEEHWRLLYVALTRAEERLVVCGALGKKSGVSENSWYARVARGLAALGAEAGIDGIIEYGAGAAPSQRVSDPEPSIISNQIAGRPHWLDASAPIEARPPRPLSPSALTDDTSANPPPSALLQAAAERGRFLHALFERLPGVAVDQREQVADQWLARSAGVADAATRVALVKDALAVIVDPRFAEVFSADALAEAPIAGVVDGVVIAGTVDRLLVTDTCITVIDFKTARRVPADISKLPEAHIRQMAAYVAVLQGIFPRHEVKAALLYSSGPTLFTLDASLMAAHKPSFQLEQQVLDASA